MKTTNEALIALARVTAAKAVAQEARIAAVTGFVGALAMQMGMTAEEVAEAWRLCEARAYEKVLHRLEDEDPGMAADLDLR